MRTLLTIFLVSLAPIFNGCSSTPAQPYSKAPPAPDGYATVYIYRIAAYPPTRRPEVLISDVRVFEPEDKTYTWVYVKQGATRIVVEWSWDLRISPSNTGFGPSTIAVNLSSGESYYIKVSGSWRGAFGGGYAMSAWSETVPALQAESELVNCCRFIKPQAASIR